MFPDEPQVGKVVGGTNAQGVGLGTEIFLVQVLVHPPLSTMVNVNVQVPPLAGGIQLTHWLLLEPSMVPQVTDQL